MAKMHSRKRGQAGSKRKITPTKLTWIRYKPKEIELLVTKLAKEGKSASSIGLVLRDSYGVPRVPAVVGKSISHILKEKNIVHELPDDLLALIKRAALIRKHLEVNKKDMTAFRGMQLSEAKIKRLAKYYKREGRIALGWKYDPASVKVAE